MLRWIVRAGLVSLALGVLAGPVQARSDYDAIMANTPWKKENGQETRTLEFPGGVSISQSRKEGSQEAFTIAVDKSGRGAVLCTAMFYMMAKVEEEMCPRPEGNWGAQFDWALDRIHAFIVENSLSPVTLEEVVANTEKQVAKFRESLPRAYKNDKEPLTVCEAIDRRGFSRSFTRKGVDAFRAKVEHALAVPRPPVTNPCL